MTQPAAIETWGLTKRFSPTTGVFDLDLTVAPGQIFGFLGPNGAGKTTTIRLLLDYLRADAGQVSILGMDSHSQAVALRHRIGYLPAEFNLYEDMSSAALLAYLARFRPAGSLERAREMAERLGLTVTGKIRHYSKGTKQKVALIQAMMHDPDLLILDEPTDGFDPLVQQEFHRMLMEARSRGKTVFLSSHVLSEVEEICDAVAIIREGQLLAVEGIERLRAKKVRILTLKFAQAADPGQIPLPGATLRSHDGDRASFAYSGSVEDLLATLPGLPIVDFTFEPARLEEIFMSYYEAATK